MLNVEVLLKKHRIHPARLIVLAAAIAFGVWICLPGFVNAGTFLGVMLSVVTAM